MARKLLLIALFTYSKLEGTLDGFKRGTKLPNGTSERLRVVVELLETIYDSLM